ncbi:hypothetical protein GCM10011325_46900 [Dyadobacter sediminis]|nr:hypothetical protein GCM10011325_46900 [Dyadobacter sediminis]
MLANHIRIPVNWVKVHGLAKPNHIYMLPVNKLITIQNRYLRLFDRDPDELSNWQ